jgi:hypothetical protein
MKKDFVCQWNIDHKIWGAMSLIWEADTDCLPNRLIGRAIPVGIGRRRYFPDRYA